MTTYVIPHEDVFHSFGLKWHRLDIFQVFNVGDVDYVTRRRQRRMFERTMVVAA